MGRRFEFRCGGCAYSVEVSGGPDVGMTVATQTIACAKCKALFDVTTSEDPANPDAAQARLRCPRSRGSAHRVTPWNGGDPCPRCNGALQVTGDVQVLWD